MGSFFYRKIIKSAAFKFIKLLPVINPFVSNYMIQKLHIENYAIIDELEINFSAALNIITGETGAGKSILVGALSLILGERADSSVLQQKEKKCIVEGYFKIDDSRQAKQFLSENDLDVDDELVIRREIAVNGKSRAFINDSPVNLVQLKALSFMMVDLHQQFDTLELGSSNFQQQVIDALAGNGDLLQKYIEGYHLYLKTKKELEALKDEQAGANAVQDYNQFLYDELVEASLKENELEELDIELKLLSNAENIKHQLGAICFELKESEQPVIQQIKSLSNKLHGLEQYHSALEGLVKRLQSSQIELEDIACELETINDKVQYNAERVELVNDRIALGYKLQKKHGVTTTAALLQLQHELENKLKDLLNINEAIVKKDKLTAVLLEHAKQAAVLISTNRKNQLQPFTEKVNALLVQVGMPNAMFKVSMQTLDTLNENGVDKIEFLFNANLPAGKEDKSSLFEPLGKVASGGELSRLMLSIKSLVAKKLQLPTLIFDEIDTGISGEAAKQVGSIMKDLSRSHQLIAITHQPQIAARADAHYFVYKAIEKDKIVTSVKLLNNDERITTIAQMLSGEKPTAAALENAKEMVRN